MARPDAGAEAAAHFGGTYMSEDESGFEPRFRPISPRLLLEPFERRWPILAGAFLVPAILAWVLSLAMPATYTASAKILLDRERVPLGDIADVVASSDLTDSVTVSNEIAVLLSNPVLNAANARLQAPPKSEVPRGEIVPLTSRQINEFSSRLDVARDLNSMVINVSAKAPTAEAAAALANAVVEAYLASKVEALRAATDRTLIWINGEVARLREAIEGLSQQAQTEREALLARGLVDPDLMRSQVKAVADAYVAARIDRDKAVSELDALRRTSVSGGLDTSIRRELSRLEIEMRVKLDQVAGLELETQRLQRETLSMAEAQSRIADITREAEATQKLYVDLLTRRNEISAQQEGISAGARALNVALVPDSASGPKRKLFALVAGMGGLMAAIGAILLWDAFSMRFRSLGQLEEATGLPVLGAVFGASDAQNEAPARDFDLGIMPGWNSIELSLLQPATSATASVVALLPASRNHDAAWLACRLAAAARARSKPVRIVAATAGMDVPPGTDLAIAADAVLAEGADRLRARLRDQPGLTLLVLPAPTTTELGVAWCALVDRVVLIASGRRPEQLACQRLVRRLRQADVQAAGFVAVI